MLPVDCCIKNTKWVNWEIKIYLNNVYHSADFVDLDEDDVQIVNTEQDTDPWHDYVPADKTLALFLPLEHYLSDEGYTTCKRIARRLDNINAALEPDKCLVT